jgi:hypothetical protein
VRCAWPLSSGSGDVVQLEVRHGMYRENIWARV